MDNIFFSYQYPAKSNCVAPYLKLLISPPLDDPDYEIAAMIDTGYDGNLVVPYDLFVALKLYDYQFPNDWQHIVAVREETLLKLYEWRFSWNIGQL